ncbi:MAG: Trm112 family protein [Ignavibacteriales bacterium]|nr:Trm112 family protein [Ignavibacteriales bacterium]
MLKKELLDILCCPKCKGSLDYNPTAETLTCTSCATVYPVKDDIPIMLVDEGDGG